MAANEYFVRKEILSVAIEKGNYSVILPAVYLDKNFYRFNTDF